MNRKPIFDAIRRMLGRGFAGNEVALLDAAIDDALNLPKVLAKHRIGPAGIALIQKWEGCARARADGRFEAYPDPASGSDPWTIGWGSTGTGISSGVIWTQAQCDTRLEHDLARYTREVARAIGLAPTTSTQFDALVSFHYNTGAIAKATLTRFHREGRFDEARAEFGKWINGGGRVMPGLIRRRAEEARLYAHLNDST